ncbi:IPT/TIG domain-containing protein [Methanospirillum sp. J.3.6.1-F.2.7.3]|uniref:IPT/TIG domain-containing protein n=1 Tax=Methanospirillum purgamenti TaxID=2834276 RepID=A0A8E7AYM1_9EURY|nr:MULTISPECIES: IPT/TIG domain-containing protein [Methanospirillum]MDX8551789.1 IPT/TIG domain-containing protein [Methanospirillum hungatei]QVV89185.1 IPT/TIG domain-containing protein [Methanospirillum sp. J.3.6.1-F.2.7.3]
MKNDEISKLYFLNPDNIRFLYFGLVLVSLFVFFIGVSPVLAVGPNISSDVTVQLVNAHSSVPGASLIGESTSIILVGEKKLHLNNTINNAPEPIVSEKNDINGNFTNFSSDGTQVSTLFTTADPYLKSQTRIGEKLVDERITGPGLPPQGWLRGTKVVDMAGLSTTSIGGVPALAWSYGCSPTSASMLFGYYDRNGYPNMYVGPTNGGVFPLTNEVWGNSFEAQGQCPLSASQYGLDGRTTRGHKDDYYHSSNSNIDPYFNNWVEHSPPDCLADFMGTSMYHKYANFDGGTLFLMYNDGSPTYDIDPSSNSRDGMHGMRLFAESRGYTVSTNYNQYIDTMGLGQGFTYAQYKAEIDAGHPVLIQLVGHTMLGVGYSGTDQVIIHNTWDYNSYSMTWGGYYEGRQHYGVGVFHLAPTPTITSINPEKGVNTGTIDVIISGTNFASTANSVQLTSSGQSAIISTNVNYVSPTQITCRLPLSGKNAGTWNVVLSTGGRTVTKVGGFTITTGTNPKYSIGVFRGNKWYLDYSGNGAWGTGDKTNNFGLSGDKPVTGDWNKDGKTKIGVFRGNKWYLDYNSNGVWNGPSTDRQYTFGLSGDKPVTGDWNKDGKTKVGVFRGNKWYLDYNGNGAWNGPSTDRQYTFGLSGDTPVTGDWNGDGKTDIGVFRGNKWYLDYNGNGVWNGPSTDRQYTFGLSGDTPVTGDWNGDGKTDIGVFRGNKWYLDSSGNGAWGTGDKTFTFGLSGDTPVTGTWSGSSGTASIQSVDLNPITKPESAFNVPDVARPVAAAPKVEMPVKSSPAIQPMTPKVGPSQLNPFVSGGAKVSRNPLS